MSKTNKLHHVSEAHLLACGVFTSLLSEIRVLSGVVIFAFILISAILFLVYCWERTEGSEQIRWLKITGVVVFATTSFGAGAYISEEILSGNLFDVGQWQWIDSAMQYFLATMQTSYAVLMYIAEAAVVGIGGIMLFFILVCICFAVGSTISLGIKAVRWLTHFE